MRNQATKYRPTGMLGLAAFATVIVPTLSRAAVIIDTNAPWPVPDYTLPSDTASHIAAIAPNVDTLDAIAVGTHANRGISGTRINYQGFRVTQDMTISSIYLSANNYNNQPFNISFFNTTNTNGNPLTPLGTQVGNTITVDAFGATASGDRNLRIDLLPSEQFTLPAVAANAGYVMTVTTTPATSGTAFNWVMSNTGTDIYTAGRYRRDDNDQTNTRDYGLALTVAPEPTCSAILAAFVLLALRRRRI
jgi:hypothetical protein